MRLFAPFIPALFAVLALTGCARQETGGGKPVSSRIQYDVTIKSPDPSFDWWVQNIDGASREVFVRQILEAAYEGKVRA